MHAYICILYTCVCVCMYAHMYIHVTIKEESMHFGGVQYVDALLIHELLKK